MDDLHFIPDSPAAPARSARSREARAEAALVASRPLPQEQFKLVLLAAFGGTVFFTLLCIGCHLATGGKPPEHLQRLIESLLDMAKIGFGAVVALLGKSLQAGK